MTLRVWLAGMVLLLLSGPALRAADSVVVEETPLGNVAEYDVVKAATFSTDCSHIAFVAVKGEKHFVVSDGVPSVAYDWVIPGSLAGPLDLSRLGFLIQNGSEISAVVDGKIIGTGYYSVGGDRISFSDDGKHYAFTARRGTAAGDKAFVVHDGVEGKAYPAAEVVPALSPDGTHLAYTVSLGGGKMCVVLDDKDQKTYDLILPGTTVFSPDSSKLAYTAGAGTKFIAVIDGQEGKAYDGMRMTPVFSPDSKRSAYIAASGTQYLAVIDGVEGPLLDRFTDGSLVFSPDSHHVAYSARKGKQWMLYLDGKPQAPFESIIGGSIHFTPDSAHVAYVVATGTQRQLIVDGKAQKPVDEVLWPGPLFSPDSKRVACVAARNGQALAVIDGVEGPAYDSIADPVFSPDSKHFAYRALTKSKAIAVLDGKESEPTTATTPIVFSPDGRRWVYAAPRDASTTIRLDGRDIGKTYSAWFNGARPSFRQPGIADLLMVRDKQYLHVRVRMSDNDAKR